MHTAVILKIRVNTILFYKTNSMFLTKKIKTEKPV